MRNSIHLGVIVLLSLLLVCGCNIFSFTSPDDSEQNDVADGWDHLWDGEFEEAVKSFSAALEDNPKNAEARWGRAKARLRTTGHNTVSLVSELSQLKIDSLQGDVYLPFMDPIQWPDGRANTLYKALIEVEEDIWSIYSGYATNEEFGPNEVRIDFAAVTALRGILKLRDTWYDSTINRHDVNIFAMLTPGGQLEILEWNQLDQAAQDTIIFQSVVSLNTSLDALEELADEGVDGVDTENLDDVLDTITGELVNDYYNGDFCTEHPGQCNG